MKKTLIFLMLMQGAFISMQAQTHDGTGAGTIGLSHSYFGYYAGNASTNSSSHNSFFGAHSGRNTDLGYSNTASGSHALYNNTGGFYNTAIGAQALFHNISGDLSAAVGKQALFNSNGVYNDSDGPHTANGYRALYSFTALYTATPELPNTAIGSLALANNINSGSNIATGFRTLYSSIGVFNTATGAYAMDATPTGSFNSAYGFRALSTAPGSWNAAFGYHSLNLENSNNCDGAWNTAFGANAGFGPEAGCNLNNTTALGYNTRVTASNQVRIGNSDVSSIGGQVSWSILSDGRFKKELKKDVSGLDFINQLNPVSYTLDKDAFDKFLGIPDSIQLEHAEARKIPQHQVGFVAQEVESIVKKSGYVFSGVEIPQNEKDPYTIRYAEFVMPLVKAVQELSVIADARQKEIVELQKTLHKYMEGIYVSEKQSPDATLFKNNPNPFSHSAEIQIELPEVTTQANLIYLQSGRQRIKKHPGHERGNTTLKISRSEFSPGMYLYALIADGDVVATNELDLK
jgi:hypothetical protein